MDAPTMGQGLVLRLFEYALVNDHTGYEKGDRCGQAGVYTDVEAGHTAGRDARHRDLDFLPEAKRRFPFYPISLRPSNDLSS